VWHRRVTMPSILGRKVSLKRAIRMGATAREG
jgi:hypothetical protein